MSEHEISETPTPSPAFVRPKPGRPRPKVVEAKAAETKAAETPPPTKANEQPQPPQQPPPPPPPTKKPDGRRNNGSKYPPKQRRKILQREHDAREAYRLFYIEKKTLREIAEKLKKSTATISTSIKEERRRLRGAFTEDALDNFNFALYELRSLYGRAMDNYILTDESKQGRLAAFVLDKIIKMTVGYLPAEHRISGSLDVNHAHTGVIGVADLAQLRSQMLNDPNYLDYLRSRALVVDTECSPAESSAALAIG